LLPHHLGGGEGAEGAAGGAGAAGGHQAASEPEKQDEAMSQPANLS